MLLYFYIKSITYSRINNNLTKNILREVIKNLQCSHALWSGRERDGSKEVCGSGDVVPMMQQFQLSLTAYLTNSWSIHARSKLCTVRISFSIFPCITNKLFMY